MLCRWSLAFFIVAILGALFAFGGVAQGATVMAPALYVGFIAIFVASLVWGLAPTSRRTPPHA